MNMLKHLLAMSALTFGLIFTNTASAYSWPSSVVGSFSVVGNQSLGTLNITSQSAFGVCRAIAGTIYGNPIEGFYCPSSGRIAFVRKLPANNDTLQSWIGNLSESQPGQPLRIGGTFVSINAASGGTLGEYNWNAVK